MAQGAIKGISKLVLIGGSAGSLEVILQLVQGLKEDISFAMVIVVHRKISGDNIFVELLESRTKLAVKEIEDKDALHAGTIYIATGDYHLLFERSNVMSLDYSEKVNFSRPSIDVSFESAADVFGSRLVCIVLSGANADGANGSVYVREKGGTVIVQSPETAEVAYMPAQVIANKATDHIFNAGEMISYLNGL
jgi:two-component system chemotaxis response regulator CheB